MAKEKLKIRVQDVNTGLTIYECAMSEADKAYSFAAEMELIGLNVKLIVPTLSDTLTSSLGLSNEEQDEYRQTMQDEFEQHEGSCCFEDSDKKVH